MKRAILLMLLPLGFFTYAQNQDSVKIFKLLSEYKVDSLLLDFTVPDIPAFKALGTNPSDILRPSDIQKFALSFTPFFDGGNTVIPSNFAVDFAPWKLLAKNWTVEDYRKTIAKRIGYNSSFSLGTVKDNDTGASSVAVGYRVKLFGKEADLLTSDYLNRVYDRQRAENDIQVRALDMWLEWKGISRRSLTSEQNEEFGKYFEDNLKLFVYLEKKGISLKEYQASPAYQQEFNESKVVFGSTQELVKEFNKSSWNAARVDLAFAVVGQSPDSLVDNLHYSNFNLWLTAGLPVGQVGQLLIGTKMELPKDDDVVFSISSRLYFGNQKFRWYGEYQYKTNSEVNEPSALLNLGTELKVLNSVWVDFYAGIEDVYAEGSKSHLRTTLNLKYSFNKN